MPNRLRSSDVGLSCSTHSDETANAKSVAIPDSYQLPRQGALLGERDGQHIPDDHLRDRLNLPRCNGGEDAFPVA